VPLSTQVYKWVPAKFNAGGNPEMDWHPIQGGVEILLVAKCYRSWDKLRPGEPLGCDIVLIVVMVVFMHDLTMVSGTCSLMSPFIKFELFCCSARGY